jgi:hypothetical protein
MEKLFNLEQWRLIAISTVSLLFGYLTKNREETKMNKMIYHSN